MNDSHSLDPRRHACALGLHPRPAKRRSRRAPLLRRPARRRASGVTMTEAVIAVSIGALLILGATTVGLNIMSRVQSNARVEEVSTIVEAVWDRYTNASEYTALSAATVARTLPERMTNDAQDQIFLGGGVTPVFLAPGADGTDGADEVGALTAQTFILVIGTQNFPMRSTLACERILSRWDDQDPRFLGFQVVSAATKPDAPKDAAAIRGIPDGAAATNFTVRKAGTAIDLNPTTGPIAPATPPSIYGADTHQLRSVLSHNVRHACEVLTEEIPAGAVIILAFA